MASCLLWVLVLGLTATYNQAKNAPAPPQHVSLTPTPATQQLSISWLGGSASSFDVEILRTELQEAVFNETLSVKADAVSSRHQWNWTSAEPLECTSLSVRLRSRDGADSSAWSPTEILAGMDIPSNDQSQMYPQDRVVSWGSRMTFCCVVAEGQIFQSMLYNGRTMNVTQLSRRSYAATSTNQQLSIPAGTNVVCTSTTHILTGTVLFVGYPPEPSDLVCETNDLVSVLCQWKESRDTNLYGKKMTSYTLNGRPCSGEAKSPVRACGLEQWEGNWTLVASNTLGHLTLNDSAQLSHRVHPVAPVNLTALDIQAWNTSLQWQWAYPGYRTLGLICQVELTSNWHKTTHTFSGAGLSSAVLLDLQPDEDYKVRARCGALENFWKWGDWSSALGFKTKMDRPEALDVWVWMDSDDTGRLLWKPLQRRARHGQITGYEVTLWSPLENRLLTFLLSDTVHTLPLNLTQTATSRLQATVTATNAAGVSPPATLVIPGRLEDPQVPSSRVAFQSQGFPLSWQAQPNASCGYVVEWRDASCSLNCSVDWTKVPAGTTNVSAQSDGFLAGVRYTFSLYACSSEGPQLLETWQGYMQELAPALPVPRATISQQGSEVLLGWKEIPLEGRRGFILGYRLYLTNSSQLTLIANISDPSQLNYTVKGLPVGTHKFTIKAFTSAGEDTGAPVSIFLEPYVDWLILYILVALGTMACLFILVTIVCYKKRNWVKNAFYPHIPEPKLAGDWSRTQGPLDVKPSPHNVVHIVDNPEWDSSKEALVTAPQEDDDGPGFGDEPSSLRYYNQMVDERPIRPRYPGSSADSSASSGCSAHTSVTYTGIQTSASTLVLQPLAHDDAALCSSGAGGYRPQRQSAAPGQGPPEAAPGAQATSGGPAGGYQPQCSWHLDSPVGPSLGSPTSVTSSQFLLPAEESEDEEGKGRGSSASTWFHNLLSSGKP
ncbi:LIF receptor subunit alpha a [Aplochiton taeniatus]